MVRDPAYGLSAEVLEYTRQRYEETNDLQSTISADIGVSRGTLNRVAKAQGWQLRKDRPPRGLSQALKLDIEATEAEDQASKAEARTTDRTVLPMPVRLRTGWRQHWKKNSARSKACAGNPVRAESARSKPSALRARWRR